MKTTLDAWGKDAADRRKSKRKIRIRKRIKSKSEE
jgi:hypothetical protein